MGVHIDDAGGEGEPAGVDRLGAPVLHVADGNDLALLDRDVGAPGFMSQTVDDGRAANDQVDHYCLRRARAPYAASAA